MCTHAITQALYNSLDGPALWPRNTLSNWIPFKAHLWPVWYVCSVLTYSNNSSAINVTILLVAFFCLNPFNLLFVGLLRKTKGFKYVVGSIPACTEH